jgi:hypothetical protein
LGIRRLLVEVEMDECTIRIFLVVIWNDYVVGRYMVVRVRGGFGERCIE